MTADRARVLRKIRACLRLSRSCNPNEAAVALRQAQKLMADNGVDAATVAFDIGSSEAATRHRGTTPLQSVVALAALIAGGFRCRAVIARRSCCFPGDQGRTSVRFYGAGGDAEVAVYAFTVMRRQLDADKARHVRRCRKRVVKESRAEAFALGWVSAVRALFPDADLTCDHARAIDLAIDAKAAADGARLGETTGRQIDRQRAKDGDRIAGYIAGKSAHYRPGMKGSARPAIGHDDGVTP